MALIDQTRLRFSRLAILCLAVVTALAHAQGPDSSTGNYSVGKYVLVLQPNTVAKSVQGEVEIHLQPRAVGTELVLDIGDLTIESVTIAGEHIEYRIHNQQLVIRPGNENLPIVVRYQGSPPYGMRFTDEGVEVSTGFSTSQWMPVMDSPAQRAALDITLLLPANFEVAASGELQSTALDDEGRLVSRWVEEDALPSYLYGFAAGKFREVVDRSAEPKLRYLAPPSYSPDEIIAVFQNTRDMIAFFEEKSGIAYPDESYTQVLLREGVGQELNEMAVMGTRYGLGVLADETQVWLGAHEVAHQWWGNRITNESWTQFWLNEGIVSFLTTAYLEHRFGRAFYDRNMEAAQAQLQRLRDGGHDKPLVFPDWDRPTREDRSVVYDKGSYVVHLLRERLGEQAFWRGIKLYSQRHWNSSVSTGDFQAAMEEASSSELSGFFDEWVY